MASKEAILKIKTGAMQRVAQAHRKVREGVDFAEMSAGAGAAGYLDGYKGDMMGMPLSGTTGLLLAATGMLTGQRDVAMFGRGAWCGYCYRQGYNQGTTGPKIGG